MQKRRSSGYSMISALSVLLLLVSWTSILVIVAALSFYLLYQHHINPLSELPNAHWSSPFSRVFILYHIYRNQRRQYALYKSHLQQYDKKGVLPLVRIGPNEVSVMSWEGIRSIYLEGWEKSENYTSFRNFKLVLPLAESGA